MEKTIAEIVALAKSCDCGNNHNQIPIERIAVGNGAIEEVVRYLEKKSFKHPVLVADKKTYEAAGKKLAFLLEKEKIVFSTCLFKPDDKNDVVADEVSIVNLFVDTPHEADLIIAVGSGTIHDIARFCSYKMGVPFISIPTAPSVDGFTSMGAPLIVRGVKKTFQTTSPIAVFADISILKKAPRKMVAAGFGDMLAKFTSLADWKFGHLIGGEPYCPVVAQITRDALKACIENADQIAEGNEEGIRVLIEALIKSGLAMLLFGQSHPASGGEHHLSHYWEMEFLRQKRPQVLHGAKVGVSTPILADLYKNNFLNRLTKPKRLNDLINSINDLKIVKNIQNNRREIMDVILAIPEPAELRSFLEYVGGETVPVQLGIDSDLVKRSLSEAHHLRDRFTVLKFFNEIEKEEHHLESGN